jgi:acetolactate synthase-1/2/3 large subunit
MRVCDWIAEYLYSAGIKNVHGLMGGGASGLNDGFIKNKNINYICYHHEQGAGHAAIGEAKFTGNFSVVNPTTGCAGTNCATSVLNAWQDSTPVLFISGNVRTNTCSGHINDMRNINIRKYGIQEHHIVDTYKTITKFSKFITRPEDVPFALQLAIYLATNDRPGPVWLDIPSDVQTAQMPNNYMEFAAGQKKRPIDVSHIKTAIEKSERPIVVAGYGIRQAGAVNNFNKFLEQYKIPYVSTYGARDYNDAYHPLNVGAIGIKGSRAGNFAMQNADLLLILGSSLGASIIGYDPKQFSPTSYKIMVDIDADELSKGIVHMDETYNTSLNEFFGAMV